MRVSGRRGFDRRAKEATKEAKVAPWSTGLSTWHNLEEEAVGSYGHLAVAQVLVRDNVAPGDSIGRGKCATVHRERLSCACRRSCTSIKNTAV